MFDARGFGRVLGTKAPMKKDFAMCDLRDVRGHQHHPDLCVRNLRLHVSRERKKSGARLRAFMSACNLLLVPVEVLTRK